MNKVMLIGRLVKDAEVREVGDLQNKICNFTLAVNTGYIGKDGEKEVDFIPVTLWGKGGDIISKYTCKGSLMSVNGTLRIRSYTKEDESKVYRTEVVCKEFTILDYRKKEA